MKRTSISLAPVALPMFLGSSLILCVASKAQEIYDDFLDGNFADGCPARTKLWDACLFQNFATVAGGHNPRGERAERLRNRFEKKFAFFLDRIGHYACDGCGRCTEVCTAGIDIRDVLSSAAGSQVADEGGAA